jgi:hypothetical protein
LSFPGNMMRFRLSDIILYTFLTLLLLTGIQGIFRVVKEKDLLGVITVTEKCSPSADSILDGTFQQCATLYLNNHMGFRKSLIRLNSQITFSVFGISPASNVVIGKDNYLFETGYINSWTGHDFTSREKITGRVRRLTEFQRIMDDRGVNFILVFCPSKSRFMPENLPPKFRLKGANTNYDTYVDVLEHEGKGLHFIDFNRYFTLLKDTSTFTLYPKGGSHWTNFSSRYYALDSLLGYMQYLSGEKYPRLVTRRIYWSDSLLVPDDDISTLFNLIWPYPSGKITYADFGIDSNRTVKPDVLAIGDSYYWQIFGFDKIGGIFNISDFWVWNEVFYPKSRYANIKPDDYMFLKQDILNHDFLILMVTEINLPTLLNFDEKLFALFDPDNAVVKELQKKRKERIDYFRALILNDPRWTALVREKAKIRKLTFDQMLKNDAEYMVDYEINNLNNK